MSDLRCVTCIKCTPWKCCTVVEEYTHTGISTVDWHVLMIAVVFIGTMFPHPHQLVTKIHLNADNIVF